jgi:hypothetical protein
MRDSRSGFPSYPFPPLFFRALEARGLSLRLRKTGMPPPPPPCHSLSLSLSLSHTHTSSARVRRPRLGSFEEAMETGGADMPRTELLPYYRLIFQVEPTYGTWVLPRPSPYRRRACKVARDLNRKRALRRSYFTSPRSTTAAFYMAFA